MMREKLGWLMIVAVAGSLAFTLACATMESDSAEREEEENEVEVSIDQVPAPVKATILREAGGKKIEEIERSGEGSNATYEAEMKENGKEIELRITADGKVISMDADDNDDKIPQTHR